MPLPSAAELQRKNSGLGNFFEDAYNLAFDRRTNAGKLAEDIYGSAQGDTASKYQWGTRGPSDSGNRMGAGAYYSSVEDQVNYSANMDEYEGSQDSAFGKSRKGEWAQVEVPTSSTNYARPRTVAAAYNERTKTMTVVFRDGTFYNYYQVEPSEWQAFHASYSKGRPWLNKRSPNPKAGSQAVDGLFINKPRGMADPASIPPEIQEQLYRIARTNQIMRPKSAGRGKHTMTSEYTGDGHKTRRVAEPLQRAEHRKPSTNPGQNNARLGKPPKRKAS